MEFRKATTGDTEAILRLYRSVIGTPFCVWDENYPSLHEIHEDLSCGNLYVLLEGADIQGAISIPPENELDALPFWQCPDAAEIARVVTAPQARGRHLAQYMVNEIISILRYRECPSIHLLAALENPPALKTYRSCGFQERGACDMFGHHFTAFELLL